MRTPRLAVGVAATGILLALAGQGSATTTVSDQEHEVLNIMPPGQSGTITAADLATVTAKDPEHRRAEDGYNAPENFANQWRMYRDFGGLTPDEIRSARLTDYFKPATIEAPPDGKVVKPRDGVTITYDDYGVPHIKGETYSDVTYGAGYAGTRDRMFLQDVLRHAGRARSSEFLGATDGNIAMDQDVLRSSYYTEEEAEAQIARVKNEHGAQGEKLYEAAKAYVAGINAAQRAMCPGYGPTGADCPAEYAALGKRPKDWKLTDVVYIAGLIGGIFGKGGGAEYGNAVLLQRLQEKFGPEQGVQVYEDLRNRNDSEAPTTVTDRWSYGGGRVEPDLEGVAMPDPDGERAPGTGAPVDGGSSPPPATNLLTGDPAPQRAKLDGPFGTLDLSSAADGMSNAALVSGRHTSDGHPIMVAGPQTGHFTPQLWTEMALDGPGVKSRGVAFAGTNLLVQVGRGVDYAWSATSPGFDNVDTVVERLCEPDGGEPDLKSVHYVKDGSCVPMDRKVHEQTVLPNPGAVEPPQKLAFEVLRTHHGIVQLRTTVDGKPVALVHERSTYHREVDSLAGFAKANDPEAVHDATSFQQAMSDIEYTFNWYYADAEDIAYFGSGLLPQRSPDVTLDLPRWGDPAYDWRGWLSYNEHLRQTNPPTGHIINWNNKVGIGPVHADDIWDQGSVHRSMALTDRIVPMVRQGDVTREELLAAVQDAAHADTRALKTLPHLLDAIGDHPDTAEATSLLKRWLDDGALREDRDGKGGYAHQAAIALFDEWWESAPRDGVPRGKHAVARDVLRGGLGGVVEQLRFGLDDHPRAGNASSWLGPAWYGWVNKDLRQTLGDDVDSRWSRTYCGDGSADACRDALRSSLAAATERAVAAQDVSGVGELRYDKSADAIRPVTAGLVGVRPSDWQNRPTFQQVVHFTHRR